MSRYGGVEIAAVLDRFVDGWFVLILEQHQKQIVETDLTMSQAQALRLLAGAPLTTGNLAGKLGISAPAVSQLTDRLIRKQLIERRAVERDRRSVTVELSVTGRRLVDGFRRRRNEVFERALFKLSDSDRNEVIGALAKIAGVLSPIPTSEFISGGPEAESLKKLRQKRPVQPLPTTQAPETSNEVELNRISPRKRMKIEWD
ncbi:MAG TPA: MarR family transcriptional regulator [Blastocatellia bacterium]|nr:MarR family transcriptional regulator [Blastocatellia bacterium]